MPLTTALLCSPKLHTLHPLSTQAAYIAARLLLASPTPLSLCVCCPVLTGICPLHLLFALCLLALSATLSFMPGAYSQHPTHYLAFVKAALCCAALGRPVPCCHYAMPFSDDHSCNMQLWHHHLFFRLPMSQGELQFGALQMALCLPCAHTPNRGYATMSSCCSVW